MPVTRIIYFREPIQVMPGGSIAKSIFLLRPDGKVHHVGEKAYDW